MKNKFYFNLEIITPKMSYNKKYRKVSEITKDLSKMNVSKPFRRDERTEIFETKVADKNIIQRNKLKTQMCKRFTETGYCDFGTGCHFAHDARELRKPICFFGDKCKNKKNCGYDHSTEEIPEIPKETPPPQKIWNIYTTPVTKDEEMIIELDSPDTFKTHDKNGELEKLRKMMEKAEKDQELQLELMNIMKTYLRETFTEENTVYLQSTGKKSLKFIAIECDDDEFESIIDRIYQ